MPKRFSLEERADNRKYLLAQQVSEGIKALDNSVREAFPKTYAGKVEKT